MRSKGQILKAVCAELKEGSDAVAVALLHQSYPFSPLTGRGRRYSEAQSLVVFVRDGFIDRYTGSQLVFPAALRLLSRLLPADFPFHPKWKTTETHIAYWELFPTIDHVVPVTRGGQDDESNWVCTSMIKNGAKGNWTLEELGWQLVSPGNLNEWDELIGWFLDFVRQDPSHLVDGYVARWHRAALKCRQQLYARTGRDGYTSTGGNTR